MSRIAHHQHTTKEVTMWEYGDDYSEQTLVKETMHGIFRARLVWDDMAEMPEDEFGDPVFRYGSRFYGSGIEHTGYGNDVLDAARAWRYFADYAAGDTLDVFERWLRIFHDGAVLESSAGASRSDYQTYLAYTCRELREERGITPEHEAAYPQHDFRSVLMDEWIAYADGEVYGHIIERATAFDADGEPEDWTEVEYGSCWGFYGEKWAKEAAEEALDSTIASIAADMLPLGVSA